MSAALQALPSTSGRHHMQCSSSGAEALRCSFSPHFAGGRLQLASPSPRLQRLQRASVVSMAAFGRNKGAYKKYMTRQELEVEYFREWEATTVLAEEEAQRKMTPLTMIAFLPNFVKFYLIPGPIRFVWWLVWCVIQEGLYQLRKLAVIAGAKLDVATMQRRGITAGYALRQTALRRLHGKQSVLGSLLFALGGRQA